MFFVWIPEYRGSGKGLLYSLLPLLFLMLSIVVLMVFLYLPKWMLPVSSDEAATALGLLKSFNAWYKLLMIGTGLSLATCFGGSFFCIFKVVRGKLGTPLLACVMSVLMCGFCLFLNLAMILSENVSGLVAASAADIAQIETGELSTAVLFLGPKVEPAPVPGPYSGALDGYLLRVSGIAKNSGGWQRFRVPVGMHFQPDAKRAYNDRLSRDANEARAQRYEITYTEHLRFVVGIKPLS